MVVVALVEASLVDPGFKLTIVEARSVGVVLSVAAVAAAAVTEVSPLFLAEEAAWVDLKIMSRRSATLTS